MKTAIYVDETRQTEFAESLDHAVAVDPRLSYTTLGRILHRSHSKLSQIRTNKAQLPVEMYEAWFRNILPKIAKRLDDYESIGIDAMREFDREKFEQNPHQAAHAIGRKPGTVRSQLKSKQGNRYITYDLYDFFTKKPPYIKLFPELAQKHPATKPIDSSEIILAQTNEQLRRLSAMGIYPGVVSYLITGQNRFYIGFDKLSTLRRDKFQTAVQTLDDLKEFVECCRQWFTRLHLQVTAEDLELKSGKTLLELRDDCIKYLDAPDFLNTQINASGPTPPVIARGKALTILGMERFVELKQK